MKLSEPVGLLREIEHLGELSRLLLAFRKNPKRPITARELVHSSNALSGLSYRYPHPEPAIELSLHLGLLIARGQGLILSHIGESFVLAGRRSHVDLNAEQGKILLSLFMDYDVIGQGIAALMGRAYQAKDGTIKIDTSTELTVLENSVATILQQIEALTYESGAFLLSRQFEALLNIDITKHCSLSEMELWRRLDSMRERARLAEEVALLTERKRLEVAGKAELAEMVVRISAEDASAGYDIRSFEIDGSARLIEVKSSTGRKVRFEWSPCERRFAQSNRTRYWLYFVPLSHALPSLKAPIVLIRDPIELIRRGRFVESPSNFFVEETNKNRNAKPPSIRGSYTTVIYA